MTEADRKEYYENAMKAGLNSRLQVPFFTTVGKIRVILTDYWNFIDWWWCVVGEGSQV